VSDLADPLESGEFERALEAFHRLRYAEPAETGAHCHSKLEHHGQPTDDVYVLFHGFTNCPAQWSHIARDLHAQGANVLVPLAAGHGRADLSPEALTELSAAEITAWVRECVEIASGLGRCVRVVGFSFGGVCAAWAGFNLDEVNEVVLLAPAFMPYGYPVSIAHWLPKYIKITPERYVWWDPIRRGRMVGSPYSYRRLSRRGLGEVFELGLHVWHGEPRRTSKLEFARLVLNDRDLAVGARAATEAFNTAIAPLARRSEIVHLGAEHRFPHDFIDPLGPNSKREEKARREVLALLGDERYGTGS